MQFVVIVGASLAGISAARALRAQGFDGRLMIIGDECERPYDRPPLSKDFLAGNITAGDLSLEASDDALDAEWRLGAAATALDPHARTITLADGTAVGFDGAVIATGASARMLPELAGKANVHTLRTLQDAEALKAQLLPGRRLAVIGSGFIGAEVAATAASLGLAVTIIGPEPVPLAGPLGEEMGAVIGRLHEGRGVQLACGARVSSCATEGDRVTAVRLDDGREVPADVVVVGIGAVPNVAWLAESGLDLANGVICDGAGRTGIPGVVAVGDCAAWFDARSGSHQRVEHWTGALERPALAAAALLADLAARADGAVAAGSLAGAGSAGLAAVPDVKPLDLPYFWSDQFDAKLQFTGSARTADRVEIEAGDPLEHSFLAVYYDADNPVAVLGVNQVRLFTKWRRALNKGTALPRQRALAS